MKKIRFQTIYYKFIIEILRQMTRYFQLGKEPNNANEAYQNLFLLAFKF